MFLFVDRPTINKTFPKIEITISLFFLSSLIYKTILNKILYRKKNISYLLKRSEYILLSANVLICLNESDYS